MEIKEELARRDKYQGKLYFYFPDEGPFRRELYQKHLEFFEKGKYYRERCFMAANRVGKTESGAGFELASHLTGIYHDWWPGRKYDRPIIALAAADTNQNSRLILQKKLLGCLDYRDEEDLGTGLIPRELINIDSKLPSGTPGLIDTVKIHREDGNGDSTFMLRTYEQGRKIFQGFELDVAVFDEEPPMPVYNEGLIRTATTGGMSMLSFTPLQGITDVVLSFMPKENRKS